MRAVPDSDYYTRSFYEAQRSGSRSSAKAMLTHVFNLLGRAPSSVVDVGCGVGTWLRVALDLGATRVQGFDGVWVQKADRVHPEDGADSIEAFEPLLAKKGVPIARPSFVDVVYTALVGYRRRKKDHISETAQRRHETWSRSSRQVLSVGVMESNYAIGFGKTAHINKISENRLVSVFSINECEIKWNTDLPGIQLAQVRIKRMKLPITPLGWL